MIETLKCPFCQQELEKGGVDGILRGCPKCRNIGTEMLWQELIRTRKALDVAVDALKRVAANYPRMTDLYRMKIANDTIDKITALEQKD